MRGRVTVVGAGFYGSTTALRLAEYNIFKEVILTDILEGKPEGIALDMNQSRSIEGFETGIVSYGSDAPELFNLGKRLLYGPGTIFVAHTQEENVVIDDLHKAVKDLKNIYYKLEKEIGS